MQGFEVSGLGVWWVSGNGLIFCQTPDQTLARHFDEKTRKNKYMEVSGGMSGGVWRALKCHCLSGGVSLGRARPDTQTKSGQTGGFSQ